MVRKTIVTSKLKKYQVLDSYDVIITREKTLNTQKYKNWLSNRLLFCKKLWVLNENLYGQGFWGKENNSDIKIYTNKVMDSYNVIITWGKTLKYHKMHKIGF